MGTASDRTETWQLPAKVARWISSNIGGADRSSVWSTESVNRLANEFKSDLQALLEIARTIVSSSPNVALLAEVAAKSSMAVHNTHVRVRVTPVGRGKLENLGYIYWLDDARWRAVDGKVRKNGVLQGGAGMHFENDNDDDDDGLKVSAG